jgi:hypothetical protein
MWNHKIVKNYCTSQIINYYSLWFFTKVGIFLFLCTECVLEKASNVFYNMSQRIFSIELINYCLDLFLNKAIFITTYPAQYNNNNRGKIRTSLITCFCNCACIKYAWSLWTRDCKLNTNFVNSVISRLLSMYKLVVLWGAAEALWKTL